MIAEIKPLKDGFSAEDLGTLERVDKRLAGGFTLERLQVVTGIPQTHLRTLLKRQPSDYRNPSRRDRDALSALTAWLVDEEAARPAKPRANTKTFKRIYDLIEWAHSEREIIAITGGVGIGKTEAARAYVEDHPRMYKTPGAVFVKFGKIDGNPTRALARIRSALTELQGGRQGAAMDDIVSTLRDGDCLILDECNYLGNAVDITRDIYDETGVPIVMVGNPGFSGAVWNKRDTWDAQANRTMRFDFPSTTEADVDAFLAWKGITGAPMRKAAVQIAARTGSGGGLRSLAKLLQLTGRDDAAPSAAELIETARQVGRL